MAVIAIRPIDVERDMRAGAMEAYLSVIANRTNEIMKVLTIFSAIMLPLTLIAGIYARAVGGIAGAGR
jgi:magnesium transporter